MNTGMSIYPKYGKQAVNVRLPLWKQGVPTNRTFLDNKPNIVIRDHVKGTCVSIDVATSGVYVNVVKKEEQILFFNIGILQ
jgi:hypothetical protein